MSIGETCDIIKKTFRTLLIVFLTYTAFYMCFPSIIFLHFTQLGHYKEVIKSYEDIEEEAARSFLTIYAFTLLFTAQLAGRIIHVCIPEYIMKYLLSPLLVLTRIAIAAKIYKTLLDEINTTASNHTSRFWPPLIF